MSLEEIRRDLDAAGLSDEDLLLRYLMRKEDIDSMRAAGSVKDYITDTDPLIALVADLSKFADTHTIQISKPGFALTLR